MESISIDYFKKFRLEEQQGRPRNEREEMLDRFLSMLNPDRATAGLKPLTHKALAAKLAKIPTSDLHAFYTTCSNARSFGRMFWYLLKPQPCSSKT